MVLFTRNIAREKSFLTPLILSFLLLCIDENIYIHVKNERRAKEDTVFQLIFCNFARIFNYIPA